MRFAQIVMGPAGCGKSTYCYNLEQHAISTNRDIKIVNLDPAAEVFDYHPIADVRELIQVEDVMEDEEKKLGPNGALMFCMEHILDNMEEWLLPIIGEGYDGDYLVFDCPGQIELYTHSSIMKRIINHLETWCFRVCGVYTIDSHFMTDGSKFIAGSMTALSSMINIQIPYVNLLTKMDLLSKPDRKRLEHFIDPDPDFLLDTVPNSEWNKKYMSLTSAIGRILEEYSLVKFFPLNLKKDSNIENVILYVDMILGVSEDAETRIRDFEEPEDGEED